ncbi:hypothetical protein HSEST_0241 [Halapricum desulfuricans]|uniref:Uncharacterized protein n=1 Tax=Halapricum desulfuricans TaxID=2841257 RepID=A0A897NM10_9EURY|nr:hypothetical protein HSEST_0241 [Halapricum desulfuricans]
MLDCRFICCYKHTNTTVKSDAVRTVGPVRGVGGRAGVATAVFGAAIAGRTGVLSSTRYETGT